MFYPKIEALKNDQKNTTKIVKKWVPKPQKCGSRRGEMVGCEKTVLFKNTKKSQKIIKKHVEGTPARTLLFAMNSYDFDTQKKPFFGSILPPFGSLMFPKPCFLQ